MFWLFRKNDMAIFLTGGCCQSDVVMSPCLSASLVVSSCAKPRLHLPTWTAAVTNSFVAITWALQDWTVLYPSGYFAVSGKKMASNNEPDWQASVQNQRTLASELLLPCSAMGSMSAVRGLL